MRFSLSGYQPTQYSTDPKIWWDSPKELVNFSARSRPGFTVSESLRTKLPDFIFLNKYHLPIPPGHLQVFIFCCQPTRSLGTTPKNPCAVEKKRKRKSSN